jgi:hypothetical protein
MHPIVRAGASYFALAFAAGFVLGTIRELAIAGRVGMDAALLIELPLMIAISYFAARWAVRRFDVPSKAASLFAMGMLALCLLLIAEDILTRLLRGVSVFEHWAGFTLLGNATNIAGLLAFFLMPLLVRRTAGERPSRLRSS